MGACAASLAESPATVICGAADWFGAPACGAVGLVSAVACFESPDVIALLFAVAR